MARGGAGCGTRSPTDTCIVAAVKQKQIRRGVKEVQKFINKGEKGYELPLPPNFVFLKVTEVSLLNRCSVKVLRPI